MMHTKLPAFSLLELMIATVLGSILLLTAATMFITFMVGNASTNARRQLSAEGEQVMSTIEYHLRNARSATCTAGATPTLTITTNDSKTKSFCFSGDTVFFNPDSGTCDTAAANALNSNFIVVPSGSNFGCTTAANGKQTVNVTINMSVSIDSTIRDTFKSTIVLRNS